MTSWGLCNLSPNSFPVCDDRFFFFFILFFYEPELFHGVIQETVKMYTLILVIKPFMWQVLK